MRDYAMYEDDDGDITLILFDGQVYSIKNKSEFIREDGRLNPNTPYDHLGKPLSVEEMEKTLFSEKLITIINL